MTLEEFASEYQAREPRLKAANSDELKKLDRSQGVYYLTQPPAEATIRNVPTRKGDKGCHLWVFSAEGIPYVLERAELAASFASGVFKHTNLTGGAPASCGGELWIDPNESDKLYVNGCSGRYGARTARQLEDAEEVFNAAGFRVVGFGWDQEANLPAVVLR